MKEKLRELQKKLDALRKQIDELDLTTAEGRAQLDTMTAEEIEIEKAQKALLDRDERQKAIDERVAAAMEESEREERQTPGSGFVSAMYDFLCGREIREEAAERHVLTMRTARDKEEEKIFAAHGGSGTIFRLNRSSIRNGLVALEVQELIQEMRTLQAGTSPGSEAIGELMAQMISERKRHVIGVRAGSARTVRTRSGNRIPFPTSDDTANDGANVAEGAAVPLASVDPTLGVVNLDAYDHSSGIIWVSIDFIMDLIQQDAVQFITGIGHERIDKRENINFTKGDGADKPRGFVTAGTKAFDAAANNALPASEILDLMHKGADPSYAAVENAEWHANWRTIGDLKKVARVSQANRHGVEIMWENGRLGMPDRMEGHRVVVNQDMDNYGANAKPLAYGDMGQYVIRDVQDDYLIRFNERRGEYRQVGFLWIHRSDGDLLHPTAVQYAQMPN